MSRSAPSVASPRLLLTLLFVLFAATAAMAVADTTNTVLTGPTGITLGSSAGFTATVSDTTTPANIPTGTVFFYDNNILIGSGSLNGVNPPTATFSTGVLAVGSHSITASYVSNNPTVYANSSTAAPSALTVNARAAATAIVLNTPTVTVRNPGTSTVTFTVNDASGNNSGTFAANNGDATCTVVADGNCLQVARQLHAASLLPSGDVLIVGGLNSGATVEPTAEVYSASGGTFGTLGVSVVTPRAGATATLLQNGTVLIAGGSSSGVFGGALNTAEIYDPVANTFTAVTHTMVSARFGHTATLLPDGTVLLVGGEDATGAPLKTTEVFTLGTTPVTGTFALGNPGLATARFQHTATLLRNGLILITGGETADNSTELINTANAGTTASGNTTSNRTGHVAVLLPDGNVLLAGGTTTGLVTGATNSAELYDQYAGTFVAISATTTPATGRDSFTATLLNNATVLITGGIDNTATPLKTAELYSPSYDPQGTVSLSSGEAAGVDSFTNCTLVLSGTNATTCTAQVTANHFGTGSHQITGNYISDWSASTPFALDALILPTNATDNAGRFLFAATTAGTTGASEPSPFNQTFLTATPVDGTVVWTNVGLSNHSTGSASSPAQSLTVQTQPITITAVSVSRPYDSTTTATGTPTITGALLGSDTPTNPLTQQFVSSHVLGLGLSTLTPVTPITIHDPTDNTDSTPDYTITDTGATAQASGTITPASLSITANSGQTKVYGHADPTLTFTALGFQGGDNAGTVLTGALARTAGETVAGNPYAINPGTLTANADYTITFTGANFNITPATLSITANSGQTKVYGQADPVFTFASSGFQFTDNAGTVLTGALARAPGETVAGGPYAINQGTLASNTNYTISYTGANFNITPATLTITANAGQTKVYGQADPVFTFTSSGFQFTDNAGSVLTGALSRTAGETVAGSPYAISQGTLTANSNYTISFTSAGFSITPATLTITANSGQMKVYGQADPVFTFASSGFKFTDTAGTVLTGGLSRTAGETVAVGPYAISQGTLAANSNYSISFTGANFSITPATLTLTTNNSQTKIYGQVDPVFSFTSSGFQFTDNAGSVLTGALSRTAGETVAGSPYAISQGTLAANSNYTISFTSAGFSITPATLTVTTNSGQTKVYGQADPVFTFISSGFKFTDSTGTVLTGALSRTAGETVAGSPFAISQGTLAANSNYTISFTSAGFSITPATLTVTANSGQTKVYGQADPVFTFTSSGFKFTDSVGTVLTGALSRTTGETVAGSPYAINQGALVANSNYTISFTGAGFSITPAPLTITAKNQSKTYGSPFTFVGTEFTTTTLFNGDTVTGVTLTSAGAAGTATVAGSPYSISPSAAAGTGLANYNITYANATSGFIVNQAPLTITSKNQTKTYGSSFTFAGTEFTITGGSLFNGDTLNTVTLTSGGAAGTAVVAGSPYTITPSSAVGTGLANYNINYANATAGFTVNQAPLTVTAKNPQKTYGSPFNFAGTEFAVTGGTLFNGDTVTSVNLASLGAPATATLAGSPYSITPSAAAGAGVANYSFTYLTGTLQVNPAVLTVTANNRIKTYGSAVVFAGTEFTTGTLFNGDTVTSVTLNSTGTPATATIAGSPYTITPSSANGTGLANYQIVYLNGNLTVSPAPLTITANSMVKIYGSTITFAGTEFALTSGTLFNGDTLSTVTLSSGGSAATAGVGGSPYAVSPSAAVGAGLSNYAINYVNGTLTVNQAPLTITANSPSKTYGSTLTFTGTEFAVTAGTLFNGDIVNSVSLNSPGIGVAATVAGSPYTVTPSAALGTGVANYNIVYKPGNLTVTRAHLTVTADPQSRIYGGVNPALTATVSGFVNGENGATATVTGSATLSTAATVTSAIAGNPYAISVVNAGTLTAPNYDFPNLVNGQLTIMKAHLTVTADPQTRVYGAANPALTFSLSGFVNGENSGTAGVSGAPVVATGATSTSSVAGSPYTITLAAGTLTAPNYDFPTVASGSLTITPAHLTVTADAQSRPYGSANPTLTSTISGFANGETSATANVIGTSTLSTSATAASSVAGSPYAITVGTGTLAAPNYDFPNLVNGQLTVTPAPLTIAADTKTRSYGAANPPLTATVSGFVNGENAASANLSGSPSLSSIATPTSSVAGSPYNITVVSSGSLAAPNYSFPSANFVAGPLAITPAHLMVTANAVSNTFGAPIPNLTATPSGFVNGETLAASGVTGTANCTSSVTSLSPVASYTIACTQGTLGAQNYDFPAANFVSGNFVVTQATSISTVTAPATGTNPAELTFTVVVSPQFSGTPTGSVTFMDNGAALAAGASGSSTVTLTNGTASFTAIFNQLSAGQHNITAVYNGDANFVAASLVSGSVTVATTLSVSPGAPISPQTITLKNPDGQDVTYIGLKCSVLSSLGTAVANTLCTVNTPSVTVPAGQTATFNVQLATNSASAQPAPSQAQLQMRGLEGLWLAMPAVVFLPLAAPVSIRRKLLRRKAVTILGLTLLFVALLLSIGCGGGGFNNPTPLQPGSGTNTTTQPGSYVVQVTGVGPQGQTALASIPLTVGF